jgi:predicted aspartyl protease
MRRFFLAAVIAIAAIPALLSPAIAEESCQLKRIAAIPFQSDSRAHIYVPTVLNEHNTHLMLDTGAFWSGVSTQMATALNIPVRQSTDFDMTDASGKKIDKMVTIARMKLGNIPFNSAVDMFVMDYTPSASLEMNGGVLGRNLFTQMDLEIDNAGKTISLFSQDHCKGAGVYWADEAVTLNFKREKPSTPTGSNIRKKASKHQIDTPIVAAELDGEIVSVLFDTGATRSGMDIEHAKRKFGIGPGSPGVVPAGKVYTGTGEAVDTYSYTFNSLTISGIKFENVTVLLGKFDDDAKVLLGMNELKKLRMYFAFKDGMIHITAADAGRSPQ